MVPQELAADVHRRGLALLAQLPVDELDQLRVVVVEADHLRRAPRRTAGGDRPGRRVADPEPSHQAGGDPAAGQWFILSAPDRRVDAGPGPVLEDPRLAAPGVHDAALVDEVVRGRRQEAGMGLWVLVAVWDTRRDRPAVVGDPVVVWVDPPHAGVPAGDPVGPPQPGVEPLRAVRRHYLERQHHVALVEESVGVLVGRQMAGAPAVVGPGNREAVEGLPGRRLGAESCSFDRPAWNQPQWYAGGRICIQVCLGRYPSLPQVQVRQDISRVLGPRLRNLNFANQPGLPVDLRRDDLPPDLVFDWRVSA